MMPRASFNLGGLLLFAPLVGAAAVGAMLVDAPAAAVFAQAGADWPSYRHDGQLTGRSPGKGNLTEPPAEKWRRYLGGHDGLVEVNAAKGEQSMGELPAEEFAPSYLGEQAARWRPQKLVDLCGDGRLVSPPPGKVAKLLPDVAGLQQVVWEADPQVPNSGIGKCFAFDQGADKPRLVWKTETEKEVYEMLWTIGDVDADGLPDVVFMTHYRILVYDGQTGRKKSTLSWDIGRNYGQMTLVNVDDQPGDEVVVVVDSPPHVDLLKYAPEQGKLLWSNRYITDAQVLLPIDVRLYILPNGVADVDGDGRMEIVYNLYNHSGDRRWHVMIRDALSGDIRWDLPQTYAIGLADLGGGAKRLCCLAATGLGLPDVTDGLLLELEQGQWRSAWSGEQVRWQLASYDWPLSQYSIASLGPTTAETPRCFDVDGDQQAEVFAAVGGDELLALGIDGAGELSVKWRLKGGRQGRIAVEAADPLSGAVLVNIDAEQLSFSGSDCRAVARSWKPRGNFSSLPARPLAMAADLEGDGANEILIQDSHWRTVVLRCTGEPDKPQVEEVLRLPGGGLWLGRRWAGFPYSKFPVYSADLDQDGRRELLLTDVADEQVSTIVCRDCAGDVRWTAALPETPARGIVWMASGRFRQRDKVDLFVVVQNGGLGEGLLLDGASGTIVWRRGELRLADNTPFRLGSQHPALAVADADGDGLDDILGNTDPYLLAVRGSDGHPLATPRTMIGDLFPNFVVYGESMVGDWDQSGRPSIFTNTPIGGFGLVSPDIQVKWFTDRKDQPRNCSGAVGRLSADSPWLYGTMIGAMFSVFDLRNGQSAGQAEIGHDPGGYASMYAADINGDGDDEFLTVAGAMLLCIGHDPQAKWRLEWKTQLAGDTGPLTIADADNDGWLDILYTTGDGCLRCLGRRPQAENQLPAEKAAP